MKYKNKKRPHKQVKKETRPAREKAEEKPLFLLCSDLPYLGTGFGEVSRDILRNIGDVYDCHQIAWQKFGESIYFEKWYLHAGGPDQYVHNYGSESIPLFLQEHPNTAAFMTLQDIHCFDYMKSKLPRGTRPPWIAYFPVDTHDFKKEWIDILRESEFPTTYSKFGHDLLLDKFKLDTHMIYHGIDTDFWRPLVPDPADRTPIKKRFMMESATGEKISLADKFIVGMIGRLNPRKMLHRWLAIFAEFARDKDDVIAYWHCDPQDPMAAEGFGVLNNWLEALRIEDKFCHTRGYKWWKPMPINLLLIISNLFDVHLYPTGGEGFGLTIAQTMACGVPNMVTDYTTGPEFLQDEKTGEMRGELLKIQKFVEMNGVKRPHVDIDYGVERLNELYYDESLRREYGRKSIEFVKRELDLKTKIRPKFIKLIDEAIDSGKKRS
ncbi:MAG: glycosyltransferase [Candidatus Helarchaeales archaeon]